MKKLLSNPKFLVIILAEITLTITLLLTLFILRDKEIVMFILGVLAGIISADNLDKITG